VKFLTGGRQHGICCEPASLFGRSGQSPEPTVKCINMFCY